MNDFSESIKIENVVASTAIDQELDIETLAIDLTGANFNPENFPGLVYRLNDPAVVALLFGSGKLVMTGGKQPDDVEHALEAIETKLADLGLLD